MGRIARLDVEVEVEITFALDWSKASPSRQHDAIAPERVVQSLSCLNEKNSDLVLTHSLMH